MTRRRRKKPVTKTERRTIPTGREQAVEHSPGVPWPIVACFFLSGLAALLYQTVWLRQFSLVFGTSELAVATVLAAYMAGLAGGAAVTRHYLHRVTRPVRVYAALEGGIALSALAVPIALGAAGALYAGLLGGQAEPPSSLSFGQPLFYLIVTFLLLAVPTGLMGATLPLLARHVVHADSQVGPRIAMLYAINTAGAVLGTLVTAFILLPQIGLRATVWSGVLINGVVFLLARHLAGRSSVAPKAVQAPSRGQSAFWRSIREQPLRQPAWILPVMLVSGAVSFTYEVLWTRLLTHVVGGSIYAFAMMLAAFLTGIALGGGLGGLYARTRTGVAARFAYSQIGIAALSAGAYVWMQALIPAGRGLLEVGIYAVAVMLPATVMIGATFPLAVRLLAASATDAPAATAATYVWNTAGAIIGAVLAGFVLLPALGFEGTIRLAVTVSLGLGVLVLILTSRVDWRVVAPMTLLFLLALAGYRPARPDAVAATTAFAVDSDGPGREVFYSVGRSATVWLAEHDGTFDLRTNGLPEASIPVVGSPPIGQVQHWLAGLPIAARPQARSMLLVGFGGGIALENVPASVNDIDVIELEPEVIAANRAIAGSRITDPLADPRVHIVVNDARNALRLTDKRYDIIVSQPSHPWTAGASHLYTREFIELAKAHLEPDGVFLQWVGAGFIDESLLQSMAANLHDQFAAARLYQANGSILFMLGSDGELDIERRLIATGQPLSSNVLYYSYMGLNGVEDFVASLVMDEAGVAEFASGALPLTDDRNRMATHSRYLADGFSTVDLVERLARYDPLARNGGWVQDLMRRDVDAGAVAGRLLRDGFQDRVERFASIVEGDATRSFVAGLVLGTRGDLDGASDAFAAALAMDPTFSAARFALLEPRLPELAAGRPGSGAAELARDLSGSLASVVRGWQLAAAGDRQALSQLDRALAASNPRDLWYPEAVQLRADWRTQTTGDPRLAFDAIRMIDRALMIVPRPELFLLRAAAADILGDEPAFVESARSIVVIVGDRVETEPGSMSPAERTVTERRLISLRNELEGYGDRVPRAAEVAAAVTGLLDRLARNR